MSHSVDFPEPLGPVTAIDSPVVSEKETPSNTLVRRSAWIWIVPLRIFLDFAWNYQFIMKRRGLSNCQLF